MKPFNVLLVGAVIWGVTLALAFISGIAVGNSQEVAAPASSVAQPIGADGQQGQFDPAARDEFRQRFQQGGGQHGQFGGQRPGGQEGTTPGTGTGPRTGTN